MSEATVRERIKSRPKLVETELPGLGSVHIRLVPSGEMKAIGKIENGDECDRTLLVATVREADGSPVFTSTDEVAELEWPLYNALLKKAVEINRLEVKGKKADPASTA